MTIITAAMIIELRERSGAGMMECKQTLTHLYGDLETAIWYMKVSSQAVSRRGCAYRFCATHGIPSTPKLIELLKRNVIRGE